MGDAAGQVKATTGGGVIFGGLCARKAAESIVEGSQGKPLDYEERWRKAFGKTLELHRLIHSTVFRLPNTALDAGIALGRAAGLHRALEKFGDMDFVLGPVKS